MNGKMMNAPTRPSLWQNFIQCLTKKYADFSGKSSRREFWGFNLFLFLGALFFSFAGTILTLASLPWKELLATDNQEVFHAIAQEHFMYFIITMQVVFLAIYLPFWSAIIRRLRDAGFHTAWGYGYMALGIAGLIKWMVFDRFRYSMDGSMDTTTLFLAVVGNVWFLLIVILACFPSRPEPEKLPEQ